MSLYNDLLYSKTNPRNRLLNLTNVILIYRAILGEGAQLEPAPPSPHQSVCLQAAVSGVAPRHPTTASANFLTC